MAEALNAVDFASDGEMAPIAELDTWTTLFFDHHEPRNGQSTRRPPGRL